MEPTAGLRRSWPWIIAGIAFLIRLVALLLTDETGPMTPDGRDYVDAAVALLGGTPYPE